MTWTRSCDRSIVSLLFCVFTYTGNNISEGKDLISVPRVVRVSYLAGDLTTNPLAVMIVSLPEIITILHIYDLPDPHNNKAQGTGPYTFTHSKSGMSTCRPFYGWMDG